MKRFLPHCDALRLEPVPSQSLFVEIVEADLAKTSDNMGNQIRLVLRVTDGERKGRHILDRIVFRHDFEEEQRIGQGALAGLCSAIGLRGPLNNLRVLRGVPLLYSPHDGASRFKRRNRAFAPDDTRGSPGFILETKDAAEPRSRFAPPMFIVETN